MAQKVSEFISRITTRQPIAGTFFFTPADAGLYRVHIARSFVTVSGSTAQGELYRCINEQSLEHELSAWDAASDEAFESFESNLPE